MRELKTQIADMLLKVQRMDRQTMIGILAPLKTEKQAEEMIEYLETIDLTTTKQSPIIRKALEIGEN